MCSTVHVHPAGAPRVDAGFAPDAHDAGAEDAGAMAPDASVRADGGIARADAGATSADAP